MIIGGFILWVMALGFAIMQDKKIQKNKVKSFSDLKYFLFSLLLIFFGAVLIVYSNGI